MDKSPEDRYHDCFMKSKERSSTFITRVMGLARKAKVDLTRDEVIEKWLNRLPERKELALLKYESLSELHGQVQRMERLSKAQRKQLNGNSRVRMAYDPNGQLDDYVEDWHHEGRIGEDNDGREGTVGSVMIVRRKADGPQRCDHSAHEGLPCWKESYCGACDMYGHVVNSQKCWKCALCNDTEHTPSQVCPFITHYKRMGLEGIPQAVIAEADQMERDNRERKEKRAGKVKGQ